jgi:3'-5' exoribonuclease
VVRSLRLCAPEEYDWSDLVPTSDRPVEEMLAELRELVEQVGQPHLRALLEAIFGDEEFLERFAQAPGASRLHHACRGGLLEHTLAVACLCGQAAADHPELNPDLLLAGALLHDVGKMAEITPGPPWDYSDAGQFCGHVVLTDRFVLERIARVPDFPVQWQLLLTHLLLSHHGELQWGAPVRPKLPEAFALHYADNLDAKVQIVEEFRASPEAGAGLWSRRHHALETSIYLGPTRAGEDPDETGGGETGTGPYDG